MRDSVLIAERTVRGIYERLRDIRGILDDAEGNAAAIKRWKPWKPR